MTNLYWAANLHLAATHRYLECGRLMEVAFFLISYTWRIFEVPPPPTLKTTNGSFTFFVWLIVNKRNSPKQKKNDNNKNRITRIPFNLQEMK